MAQQTVTMPGWLRQTAGFYIEGFRRMTVGRALWKVIIIKLIIMFGVLKLFFFPDYLGTHFSSDQERADHVLGVLTSSVAHGNNQTN